MTIMRKIATLAELIASVPAEIALDAAEKEQLKDIYARIMRLMDDYVPRNAEQRNIELNFGVFVDTGGYQLIAEGAVSDLDRPVANEWNYHFQNTSQWLLGFGLVFDKERRDFSLHT